MNLPEAPAGIGRICFDFDGTIAEGVWPDPWIGDPIESGINLMLTAQELGYEIVIYTSRPQSHAPRIWRWLEEEGLKDLVYDIVCGKPQAQLYVDDKAYNPFVGVGDGETPSAHLEAPTMALGVETAGDVRAGERPASSWEEGAADPASALGSDVVESGPPSSTFIGYYAGVPCYVDDTQGEAIRPEGFGTPVFAGFDEIARLDEEEPDDSWVERALRRVWG